MVVKNERPQAGATANGLKPESIETESLNSGKQAFLFSTLQPPKPEDKARSKFTIYADGSCNPNPHGIGCWAYVVYDDGGNQVAQDYGDIGRGEGVTNNVAEYRAVIEGLKKALEFFYDDLVVYTDSQLVVKQLNGEWACNQPHLKVLLDELWDLAYLNNALLEWIPREQNKVADALTRLAYIRAKRQYEGGGNDQ